jgi:hypothetical protein
VSLVVVHISAALDDTGAQGCLGLGYKLLPPSVDRGARSESRVLMMVLCLQHAVRPMTRLWTGRHVLVEADDAVEAAPRHRTVNSTRR